MSPGSSYETSHYQLSTPLKCVKTTAQLFPLSSTLAYLNAIRGVDHELNMKSNMACEGYEIQVSISQAVFIKG